MNTVDNSIRVIIVDDHRLFNDGLHMMLKNSESEIEIMAQVYDSREAEEKVMELKPDVVLVDFNMPHINGIKLTKALLARQKDIRVLILSMYNEEMYIESFRKSGACGYLFKTATVEEVVTAIRHVHAGEEHFPVVSEGGTHADDAFLKKLKLSSREMEVVQLVKTGLTTKEIAEKLNISFYTVETHRKNIKVKIGAQGEAAFLRFIYSNDLNI
jgi:DNA-binding NarL/FixJ family response regulator